MIRRMAIAEYNDFSVELVDNGPSMFAIVRDGQHTRWLFNTGDIEAIMDKLLYIKAYQNQNNLQRQPAILVKGKNDGTTI